MAFDTLLRGPRPYFILILLAAALYLPGIAALPVTDRDEARFAQATRQMVETGDYVNIRFQDTPRQKKPAGIHWLQAAAVHAVAGGDTGEIWVYRLPSFLGALGAVIALFALARPVLGTEAAFIGAGILASSLLLVIEAHIAKTDAALLLCTVLVQGAALQIYARARAGKRVPPFLAWAFWAALGAGILIKGPVLPFIAAATLGTLWYCDRRARLTAALRRGLRPVTGVILCLAIAAPWFIAISIADGGFLEGAVTGDLLPKLMGGQESHGAPPGTYLALIPVSFWPGALLIPFGLVWAWGNSGETGMRFCLAWLIPAWIVFELVPTKLAHYVLPLYPAAALMAGQAVTDGQEWMTEALRRWPAWLWLAIWTVAGLALAFVIPVLLLFETDSLSAAAWIGAALLVIILGVIAVVRGRPRAALLMTAPTMALFTGLAFAIVLPGAAQLWPSAQAGKLVAAHRAGPGTPIAVAGFREPSLVFNLGTNTKLTTPEAAAGLLKSRPGALALIEDGASDKFKKALGPMGVVARALGSVQGLNLSKGRKVSLTLYRAEPAKP